MMGAGKTEVGRAVAGSLGLPHVDLDVAVANRTGRTPGVLFAERGEEGFRDAEQEALAGVLAVGETVVVSTGGGVLERQANRLLLAERATVVWLRARPATLAGRVGDGSDRPLLADGEPAAVFAELAERRGPSYEAAADAVVDTDDLTLDEVAARVESALPDRVAR